MLHNFASGGEKVWLGSLNLLESIINSAVYRLQRLSVDLYTLQIAECMSKMDRKINMGRVKVTIPFIYKSVHMTKNYFIAYFSTSMLGMITWGYVLHLGVFTSKVSLRLIKCGHCNNKSAVVEKNIPFRIKIFVHNCRFKLLFETSIIFLTLAFFGCIGILAFKFVANCHMYLTIIE